MTVFFREMFSSLLKGEGYEVDTASSGLEGLKMYRGKASGKNCVKRFIKIRG